MQDIIREGISLWSQRPAEPLVCVCALGPPSLHWQEFLRDQEQPRSHPAHQLLFYCPQVWGSERNENSWDRWEHRIHKPELLARTREHVTLHCSDTGFPMDSITQEHTG